MIERRTSSAPETEESLLACLVLENAPGSPLDIANLGLRPRHFASRKHGELYGVILDLARSETGFDRALLFSRLRERGLLDRVGGREEILRLADLFPSGLHAPEYALAILEAYNRRKMIEDLRQGVPVVQVIERASASLPSEGPRRPFGDWPAPPSELAYRGPVGEAVQVIAPHTEADPAAILTQALISFGSAVGRGPYYRVEADEHRANEFVLLVGETARGRKGTSKGHAMRIMREVDPEWAEHRVKSGLSSGEGLIQALQPDDDNDRIDGRLLVEEPEFVRVLEVGRRDGNTLTSVLRHAWDGDRLSTLTRKDPLEARDFHVSIAAHVTQAELERRMAEVDLFNGYLNRFLLFRVRRTQLLPIGSRVPDTELRRPIATLKENLERVRRFGDRSIPMSPEAEDLWKSAYPTLSRVRPGILDPLAARAEAHVLRLALIYALSTVSLEISRGDLEAAMELWALSERSLATLFAGRASDPLEEKILQAVRAAGEQGLNRTELHRALGNNSTASKRDCAVQNLESLGWISQSQRGRQTRYFPVMADPDGPRNNEPYELSYLSYVRSASRNDESERIENVERQAIQEEELFDDDSACLLPASDPLKRRFLKIPITPSNAEFDDGFMGFEDLTLGGTR